MTTRANVLRLMHIRGLSGPGKGVCRAEANVTDMIGVGKRGRLPKYCTGGETWTGESAWFWQSSRERWGILRQS